MLGATRLDRWVSDWPKTPIVARVFVVFFALACMFAVTDGVIYNLQRRSYLDVALEAPVLVLLLLFFVVWPYRLAWAVRRRGGSFGFWYAAAILFSSLFVGIFYLAKWSRAPILAEYNDGESKEGRDDLGEEDPS